MLHGQPALQPAVRIFPAVHGYPETLSGFIPFKRNAYIIPKQIPIFTRVSLKRKALLHENEPSDQKAEYKFSSLFFILQALNYCAPLQLSGKLPRLFFFQFNLSARIKGGCAERSADKAFILFLN